MEDRQLNLKNEKNLKYTFEEIQEMKQYLYRDQVTEREEIAALRL